MPGQAIASRVHVSLSNASLDAEKAVGTNSHAVWGGLGTQLGFWHIYCMGRR